MTYALLAPAAAELPALLPGGLAIVGAACAWLTLGVVVLRRWWR